MGKSARQRKAPVRRNLKRRSSERKTLEPSLETFAPSAEQRAALQKAHTINTIADAQVWFNTAHHDAAGLVALAHRPRDYARYAIDAIEPVFFHNLVVYCGGSRGVRELRRSMPAIGVGPRYGICSLNWHELVIDLVTRITSFICWAVADVDNIDPVCGSIFSPSLDTPYRFRNPLIGCPMPKEITSAPKRYLDATRKALCEIPYNGNDWDFVRNKLLAAFLNAKDATPQDGPWSHEDSPKQWAKLFDMSESTFRRRREKGVIRCKVITEKRIRVHIDDLPKRPK